jgi:hypothetical protein
MIHAYGDFVTADGTRLEGRGVVPDQVVPLDRGPLLAGRDATLDAALAWLDDTTVAVLTGTGGESEAVELLVGGPTATADAPSGSTQIAGAQGAMRVKDVAGGLYSKRGATWPQTASGIVVLATQQGSPR